MNLKKPLRDNIILRAGLLVLMALAGIILVVLLPDWPSSGSWGDVFDNIKGKINNDNRLYLIILPLPVLVCLWFFKTIDTKRQIQNQEETNNFNNFSHAVDLLFTKENPKKASLGLRLIIKLKTNKLYLDEIDAIWSNQLEGLEISMANLSGLDLSDINFNKANLKGANLENANLEGANLEGANLEGANLEGANLTNASLAEVNLGIAIYDSSTKFPANFESYQHITF